MDKETLSNYGWIVICVLVIAVMLALATPFGSFISNAIQKTTQGLFDVNQSALDAVGVQIKNQYLNVDKDKPILAPQSTWYSQGEHGIKRSTITEINIKDTYTPNGEEGIDYIKWDASEGKVGTVTAYIEDTILTIAGNGYGCIFANEDSKCIFSDSEGSDYFKNITIINNAELIDTQNVTTLYLAFNYCESLQSVSLSTWDVSSVTLIPGIFQHCHNLKTVDIGKWDVSQCTDMRYMFSCCYSIEELYLNNWDTSNVTDMQSMFATTKSLRILEISNWNVEKVTTMQNMFREIEAPLELDLSKWNTKSLTNIRLMFFGSIGIKYLDVSGIKTDKCTYLSQVFEQCDSLTEIHGLNTWNTENITGAYETFWGCNNLKTLDLSSWDTSKFDCMYRLFGNCNSIETIYVSEKWSTESLTHDECLYPYGDHHLIGYNDSNIFSGCNQLVGGEGSKYTKYRVTYSAPETSVDKQYAKIDGGSNNPGYLTYKPAN